LSSCRASAVGYDNIDIKYAVAHGITVTNTPEVLNRGGRRHRARPAAVHGAGVPPGLDFLRAGKWMEAAISAEQGDLAATAPSAWSAWDASAGRFARRLDGFGVPVVYHSRNPQTGVSYRHYPKMIDMARDVDTLILITPGGPSTRHLVNAEVLEALGPGHRHQHVARHGGRRCSPDQGAEGAENPFRRPRRVSSTSPRWPKEYLELDNIVLFPHLGSSTVYTRQKMEQALVVDNLLAWAAGKPPLTPVARDTMASEDAGVIICRHGPSHRNWPAPADRVLGAVARAGAAP